MGTPSGCSLQVELHFLTSLSSFLIPVVVVRSPISLTIFLSQHPLADGCHLRHLRM